MAPFKPSRHQIFLGRLHTITLCWAVFIAGWNDGTLGPLLRTIQKVYNLSYVIVSLLFVFQSIGAITGALLNITLTPRLGFGKVQPPSTSLHSYLVGYSLQAAAPPFPVFVLSCAFNGIGVSILDAQANGYVASLSQNSEARMGYVQAAYGAGVFAAPLVSTQFAQLRHWSFHYLVSLGITLSNMLCLYLVFRCKSQDENLARLGQTAVNKGNSEHSHMRQILSNKAVHLLTLFLFVNVGVGVAISGWIVTFMVDIRGGGPSAGYIAAGFAGGLTVGRVTLIWVNKKIGETRVIYLYSMIAVGLELIVWLVPSLVGGAVAVSFVGLVFGPMYPLALNRAAKLFPPWLLTGTISWMAAMATVGGATVPFVTGAISTKAGIKSLEPVIVSMTVAMLILWALVPNHI
ncbi:major facilitator superfamily domain-containing protein [Mycena sp. CBHHK59/15]|nr:major facilitator superfamily domain-containing protein [Mycena sp. CBHHK59/15]